MFAPTGPEVLLLIRLSSSESYSRDECRRARELLSNVAQLQPLVFGLAEELLSVSQEVNAARLQQALDGLTRQVRGGRRRRATRLPQT